MRLQNIINGLRNYDAESDVWIFDENGDVKEGVLVADVIPFLNDISEYEIEFDEELAETIKVNGEGFNTYNWGANISHGLQWYTYKMDGYYYCLMSVHIGGDIRGNYTEEFILQFDNDYEMMELESTTQHVNVVGRYWVDINIFSEGYSVYDLATDEGLGDFYELEVTDLLEELKK